MIETSVVGSYPINIREDNLEQVYKENKNWNEFFLPFIREAVSDQILAGIDIISTGQVRADMISEFTRRITGIREHKGKKYITSKVKFVKPITLDDLIYTRNLIPKNKKIKAPITGPYTLAKSCILTEDSGYKNLKELAFDFAQILNQEAMAIEAGNAADVIQIDEPMFSIDYPEHGKELINIVRQGIKIPIVLHVCGDVSNIFENLIDYNVDILDHEFAANPKLINIVSSISFNQKIGYGCVNSYNPEIECVNEIAKNIEKALTMFNENKIILEPDCGLKGLGSREIAYQKLENLVKARNLVCGIKTIEAQRISLTENDYDPKGFFYIVIDKRKKQIRLEHWLNNETLSTIIYKNNAEAILHEILKLKLVSDDIRGIRHYGHIATELTKAEIALRHGLEYIQERKLKLSS